MSAEAGISGERNSWQGLIFNPVEGSFSLVMAKSLKSKALCCVKFCRNPRAVDVDARGTVTRHRTTCNRCRTRLFRANHPTNTAYHQLKGSAKRRGIRFTLTIEQFAKLIQGTAYLEKSGSKAGSLHIDRKRPEAGYEFGNLRVITASHNVGKGNMERRRAARLQGDDFEGDKNEPF